MYICRLQDYDLEPLERNHIFNLIQNEINGYGPLTELLEKENNSFEMWRYHFDDWEDQQVPETYFERHIIPKQFCIGYLDVNNKKFVANPNFQFNYGITDEFALGTTTAMERDLSVELENSIRRSK